MRLHSWVLGLGVVVSAAACGADLDDPGVDGTVDGGGSSSSSSSGGSSSSGSSGASSSSGEPGDASTGDATLDADVEEDAASDGGEPDASEDAGEADAGEPDAGEPDAGQPQAAPRFEGRFDLANPAGPTTSWPGTRVVVRFQGTALNAGITQTGAAEGTSRYDVIVDGIVQAAPLVVSPAQPAHQVVQGLAAGEHLVELVRRTEPQQGANTFTSITAPGGQLLPPPAARVRRIEVLTESTVSGFGVESNSVVCGGDRSPFHNARKSFPQQLATSVNAELFMLGISGVGVSRGGGGLFAPYYSRTAPTFGPVGAAMWNFAEKPVDAVLISLGGADYGDGDNPPQLTAKYGELVDTVRTHYPQAHIFMLLGPQLKNYVPPAPNPPVTVRTQFNAVLDAVKAARAGDARLWKFVFTQNDNGALETGCNYHAAQALHDAMHTQALPFVREKLGW